MDENFIHSSRASSRGADDARARAVDDRAIREETLRATFRALERRVGEAATARARAVETESRQWEAREATRAREASETAARWREMWTRSRTQIGRCAEALGRRARRDEARRAVRRWRRAVEERREERERRRKCETRARRAVFEAWRGMGEETRRRRTRAGEDERLTRARASAYDEMCAAAVVRLGKGTRESARTSDLESEVRRAFMRGVSAMSLRESARAL